MDLIKIQTERLLEDKTQNERKKCIKVIKELYGMSKIGILPHIPSTKNIPKLIYIPKEVIET